MNEVERFDHWLRKVYECLHLHYKHFLPIGKPEPMHYNEVFYELYKVYTTGRLEVLSREPIMEEEVKQLDILSLLFPDELSGESDGHDS